ncbi:MAG: hypothetical protein G01um101477_209 [Candidatus Doudnabacteria bacterium Gr01-1014_77]|uniref:Uncharacterized protein n=1 Tax=Candidatus Doudnabacteria bacterium Gr01-1014_77 TaxID=2017133 RepID=A0A554JCU9_9BACT|nr:MAG: hypothetical protein G01um101477_209 [Candidatus Doudnabacteria bacterium Gr01-1014_77]
MERINKNFIIAVLAILILIIGFFWYKGTNKSIVDKTLQCAQLYELKKVKYWGNEIGQNKSVFNKTLNACLALNIYNDFQTKDYFAMIIDMSNDKTILSFSAQQKGFYFNNSQRIDCKNSYIYFKYLKNGEEIKDYGCEKYDLMDKMFEQVRDFGFEVFGASL